MIDLDKLRTIYYRAEAICAEKASNEAWLFERTLADLIVTECAKIAEDCYDYHQPLSHVPRRIMAFKRLTDEDMIYGRSVPLYNITDTTPPPPDTGFHILTEFK